jgi:adenine phosphoribosyltransferase
MSSSATLNPQKIKLIKNSIRDIPDFPKPGIVFKDITTLLSSPEAFKACIDLITERFQAEQIDYVACIESRGFIFAAPTAIALNAGLTLIRKPGKLPAKTTEVSYELEYGRDTLQIHEDAFGGRKARVLIVDDLLATGGSCSAAIQLIRKLGAEVVGAAFAIELDFLNGRQKLDIEVLSLVHF